MLAQFYDVHANQIKQRKDRLGVLHVSGAASIAGIGVAAVHLEPGAWIEQPVRSHATGFQFMIAQDFLTGKTTMGSARA